MKKILKKNWLLLFNCATFTAFTTLFMMDVVRSDALFRDRSRQVIEKKMLSARASKGRVYDDGYLRLKDSTGSQWVGVDTEQWLNTEIGDVVTERVARNEGRLSLARVTMLVVGLLWCIGAGWAFTKALEA